VTSVFLIAPPGPTREKLDDLLDSAEAAIIGRANDLETLDDELAEEADVLIVDATSASLEDVFDSLQQARLLRSARIVLISDQLSSPSVNRALRLGVRGIFPERLEPEQLAAALEAIVRGLIVLHPGELQRTQSQIADEFVESVEPLTTRERDVLQMLSQGLGNKEIAARLKLSEHTVKFHIASIFGKLGASTRTEAVSIALRRGLVLL
jgi:two-component system, NarL family, response regulator YdfI